MPLSESESAAMIVESKCFSWNAGNVVMPILKRAPFRTSLKAGDIVGFRYIVAGGERPLYYNDTGWEIVGFRHDPSTSRQELVVVHKDGKTINIQLRDIISRN